jgi:hypothetical protein
VWLRRGLVEGEKERRSRVYEEVQWRGGVEGGMERNGGNGEVWD